ncbi:MAG: DUF1501 domain-containing protein [Candidatus Promineifilaceae bacterium]
MPQLTRRTFIQGCSAAIAAMTGARFQSIVFANPEETNPGDILVKVFLRGGCDAINVTPPIGGNDRAHYEAARSGIAISAGSALPLGNSGFGLNPNAGALHELFNDNKLAIIQATGMHHGTRSHFNAMRFIEVGTPGDATTGSGWIARHLQTANALPAGQFGQALALSNAIPASLMGEVEAVAMKEPKTFKLNVAASRWRDKQKAALRTLYNGSSRTQRGGTRALDAVEVIEANFDSNYIPSEGVSYPGGGFSERLQTVAQMIKLDLGLRAVTIDLGGWDTHNAQGGDNGYFGTMMATLSDGLAAFYRDLNGSQSQTLSSKVSIVVMSEFGRRFQQNASGGTDHGHAGMMMVLGDNVNGGLHGTWPGLGADQLYRGKDLEVTTDYRRVLSEVLVRRLNNPNLSTIFPGYMGYSPLNIVSGADLPII